MPDNKQLAAIHIAKADARLSDAEYRALLNEVAGVSSSKYLSDDGYQAVMRALRDRQFSTKKKTPKTPAERKIWALWLGSTGRPGICWYIPERERTAAYLLGFARRVSDDQSLGSIGEMSPAQSHRVIEALKARLAHEIAAAATTDEIPF